MIRSPRKSYFAFSLFVGALVSPSFAQTPSAPATPPAPTTPPAAATPAPPVIETPDFPGAIWSPASPDNFKPSTRPSPEQAIDRIVIHDIEGPAVAAVRWFQNPKAQASSHYVVDSVTGDIYQQVKERDVAWHAGDRITNARSVGIEHGGFAYRPGFYNVTEYEASAALVRDISNRYKIPRDREHIIGHAEVPDSANPGKFGGRSGHTDPGPYWDWDYFMTLVRNNARLVALPTGSVAAPTRPTIVLHPGETRALAVPVAGSPSGSAGEPPVTFRLENTGDDPWLADMKDKQNTDRRKLGTVFLGTANGQESRLAAGDWISPRYVGSSVDGDIAPGASGTFAVSLRAPGDYLGDISETFRLVNIFPAPRQPVPFGQTVTVSARVEPWDIVVPLPNAVPPGWNAKTMPDNSRIYWRQPKRGDKGTAPQSLLWEANLPVVGEWDVYVRYPAGAGRTKSASYHIGAATKTVNQQAAGGQWQKLGRYLIDGSGVVMTSTGNTFQSMLPGKPIAHAVVALEASANTPGTIVAGDLRFVGPFPATPKPTK